MNAESREKTIELAHNLGLTVVAEGVEDEHTWRDLLHFGCDVAQGFHIGQPGTAAEVLGALALPNQSPDQSPGRPLGPRGTNRPHPGSPHGSPARATSRPRE